jgi:hypothetical protein
MRKALLSFVTLLVIVACSSGSTAIDIEKYDRSCANLNDCVVVATDACCGCPIAAISTDSEAQYMTDLAAAKKNCGGMSCSNMACQTVVPGCAAGLCITQLPPDAGPDAPSD